MNGLDLFSGIGGNSLALREWVKVVAYCETDRHAQAVLLSRMAEGAIATAPIWDNVATLSAKHFDVLIDIITAGFPCQDISVAGRGEGLEGKRSGLFFEIVRLAKELQPSFVFLENVPAIRTRGLETVVREFSDLGYDCRWCTVSAAQVGAPHKRERWFLLAANRNRLNLWNVYWRECRESGKGASESEHDCQQKSLADSNRQGLEVGESLRSDSRKECSATVGTGWWSTEPDVVRVANGVPLRVERLKRLGNAVVPLQAKIAFERLLGNVENPTENRHRFGECRWHRQGARMSEIKRYDLDCESGPMSASVSMVEDLQGEWVRWEDVKPLLDALSKIPPKIDIERINRLVSKND